MNNIAAAVFCSLFACTAATADWRYEETVDRMTGKKTTIANITSSNSLSLDFPYKGENHGNIVVRRHPTLGLGVIFHIDKGQIICRSYSGCSVTVRFDDKPPAKFSANESADNDSKIIFLSDAQRFIAQAKTAKTILIQPVLHQGGLPVLEFKTSAPLEWNEAKSSPPAKAKTPATRPAQKETPATVWPAVPASLNGSGA